MAAHGIFDHIIMTASGVGTRATGWEIARRQRRLRHTIIMWRRSIGVWWLPMALVIVGGGLGSILGQFVLEYPKEVIGGLLGVSLVYLAVRRLEFGLLLLVLLATPFAPKVASIRSLDVYPVEILLFALACAIAVRVVFRVRVFVWPSLATIWPLIGLLALAVLANVVIQATWIPGVPHQVGSSPVLYSEVVGVTNFCIPLAIVLVTGACLSGSERLVERLLTLLVALAVVGSVIILIEFKRIGANVYTFRYTEDAILYGQPAIFFMSLGDLAQLVGIGAMIAYARLLHTTNWPHRLRYACALLLCVVSLYVTLENSRWLEVAVALVLITLVFSRRLFVALCACSIPLLPLGILVVNKIIAIKSGDFVRLIIWHDVLRVWEKRPLLGVGPGNLWSYDQVYTHLPLYLRDFGQTGLGVAHNGLLQVLGEVGPAGVFCALSFGAIVALTSLRMYRRARTPEQRDDRILALICFGFVFGALAGDFFSGDMFIPPGQIGGFNDLPHIFLTWILFGCLVYKDQLWRLACLPRVTLAGQANISNHPDTAVGIIPSGG